MEGLRRKDFIEQERSIRNQISAGLGRVGEHPTLKARREELEQLSDLSQIANSKYKYYDEILKGSVTAKYEEPCPEGYTPIIRFKRAVKRMVSRRRIDRIKLLFTEALLQLLQKVQIQHRLRELRNKSREEEITQMQKAKEKKKVDIDADEDMDPEYVAREQRRLKKERDKRIAERALCQGKFRLRKKLNDIQKNEKTVEAFQKKIMGYGDLWHSANKEWRESTSYAPIKNLDVTYARPSTAAKAMRSQRKAREEKKVDLQGRRVALEEERLNELARKFVPAENDENNPIFRDVIRRRQTIRAGNWYVMLQVACRLAKWSESLDVSRKERGKKIDDAPLQYHPNGYPAHSPAEESPRGLPTALILDRLPESAWWNPWIDPGKVQRRERNRALERGSETIKTGIEKQIGTPYVHTGDRYEDFRHENYFRKRVPMKELFGGFHMAAPSGKLLLGRMELDPDRYTNMRLYEREKERQKKQYMGRPSTADPTMQPLHKSPYDENSTNEAEDSGFCVDAATMDTPEVIDIPPPAQGNRIRTRSSLGAQSRMSDAPTENDEDPVIEVQSVAETPEPAKAQTPAKSGSTKKRRGSKSRSSMRSSASSVKMPEFMRRPSFENITQSEDIKNLMKMTEGKQFDHIDLMAFRCGFKKDRAAVRKDHVSEEEMRKGRAMLSCKTTFMPTSSQKQRNRFSFLSF